MRSERNLEATFDFSPLDPRQAEIFATLNNVLKKCCKALDFATCDLTADVADDRGRKGMSAEQVVRFALVKQLYGWSYQQLYERVHDSIALRRFCSCEFEIVPKPSTLHENIKKLTAETFEEVNRLLLLHAKREGIEDGLKTRIDCTVVETNIHHPTDSSLLWDGIRVVTRMLIQGRKSFPEAGLAFKNRTRVCKKLAFEIANAKHTETKLPLYRELLGYGREVLGYGREGVKALRGLLAKEDRKEAARMAAKELEAIVQLLAQVIDQAHRRVIKGEQVPADEKVVSLFEPHTDIIEKGGRETEFGHKICVTVGKGNLVLGCQIEEGNPADSTLFKGVLLAHKEQYGYFPRTVALDGGFASADNAEWAKERGVEEISFTKRVGAKLRELLVPNPLQRMLAKFRAGVEAIISALKRGVGLGRCLWEGWESFRSYVWSGIAAHNLKLIARELLQRQRKAKART